MGHLWPYKRGLSPAQKVMRLGGVWGTGGWLIIISSRLVSNNDGSASAHPDTSMRKRGRVADICRYVTACCPEQSAVKPAADRLIQAAFHLHPIAAIHWVQLENITSTSGVSVSTEEQVQSKNSAFSSANLNVHANHYPWGLQIPFKRSLQFELIFPFKCFILSLIWTVFNAVLHISHLYLFLASSFRDSETKWFHNTAHLK